MNSLDYEEACKFDKRTFFQYYISLLKNKHLFLFSFYTYNDYNSRIIKIFLFFFNFGIFITINALFFNDKTIHKIYLDEGNYNFVYQIPQMLYSSILSGIINAFIKYLSLTQETIIKIKQAKETEDDKLSKEKIFKKLSIKFICFFVISSFILIFCFFYISCFCGIYINTQSHLIEDSIISFIIASIEPFLLFLIPGIFRIIALDSEKQDKEFIFKLSQFIQNVIC